MSADSDAHKMDLATRREEEKYTPLRVWLHPAKASRKLNEAISTLNQKLSTMDMTEEEVRRLRADNRTLTSRLAESEKIRADLESRLAQMKDDEAYHNEMDQRLEVIEKEFAKVEEMRRRYEVTIATLREKLKGSDAELRRLSGQRSDAISLGEEHKPDIDTPIPGDTPYKDNTTDTERVRRRQVVNERARRYHETIMGGMAESKEKTEKMPSRPVVVDGRGIPKQEIPAGQPMAEEKKEIPPTPVGRDIAVGNMYAPRRLDGTEWVGDTDR